MLNTTNHVHALGHQAGELLVQQELEDVGLSDHLVNLAVLNFEQLAQVGNFLSGQVVSGERANLLDGSLQAVNQVLHLFDSCIVVGQAEVLQQSLAILVQHINLSLQVGFGSVNIVDAGNTAVHQSVGQACLDGGNAGCQSVEVFLRSLACQSVLKNSLCSFQSSDTVVETLQLGSKLSILCLQAFDVA